MVEKKDLEKTGVVTESLPNIMFKVKLDGTEEEILTYLSGKMRLHRIRVLIGDKVLLELEPYGGKARIIKRLWHKTETSLQYYFLWKWRRLSERSVLSAKLSAERAMFM